MADYHEHGLPPGSIRLSPVEPNVASFERLLAAMQADLPATRRPRSVAVCLPDVCARTAVFEFASLPKNKKEQRALVEWRLQKELNLSPKPRRVAYQRFGPVPSRFSLTRASSTPGRFLVVMLQNDVVEQYEALCVEAGFIPVSINVAGLAVLNLCRPIIEATMHEQNRDIALLSDTVMFWYVGDWGFSLMVWKDGQPCFVRVKPLKRLSTLTVSPPQTPIDDAPAGRFQAEPSDPATSRAPDPLPLPEDRDPTSRLAQELLGSLQFFFETTTPSSHVYPLFLVGSPQPEILLPRIAETIEQAFPLTKEAGVPQIKAFPVVPQNPAIRARTLSGLTHWTGTTLAALAAGSLPS